MQFSEAIASKTERIEQLEAYVKQLERALAEIRDDWDGAERLERAVQGLGGELLTLKHLRSTTPR